MPFTAWVDSKSSGALTPVAETVLPIEVTAAVTPFDALCTFRVWAPTTSVLI